MVTITMERSEWLCKMRKLYGEIIEQYKAKDYTDNRAKMIARKVVFRLSKKRHRRITRKELET